MWQDDWTNSQKGRFLCNFQPLITDKFLSIGQNRKEEKIIHQLRLGKCRLNFYLHSIDWHENGLCDFCTVPETIQHYLCECHRYISARNCLKKSLKLNELTIKRIMEESIKDNYKSLLIFVRQTNRL